MGQQNPQHGNNQDSPQKQGQNPQHQQGNQNPNKTGQHDQADRKGGQQGQPGSQRGGRD